MTRAVLSVRSRVTMTVRNRPADLVSFHGLTDGREHIAVIWGPPVPLPLVRIHSECLTGDVFGSGRCDCGPQLDDAIGRFATAGGILLYLRQEGRGIGLYNKIDAYSLQDTGLDTVDANLRLDLPADARRYDVAGQMLSTLGYSSVRLLTNNPAKVVGLRAAGITVAERVRTGIYVGPGNERYIATKRERMGHDIPAPDDEYHEELRTG